MDGLPVYSEKVGAFLRFLWIFLPTFDKCVFCRSWRRKWAKPHGITSWRLRSLGCRRWASQSTMWISCARSEKSPQEHGSAKLWIIILRYTSRRVRARTQGKSPRARYLPLAGLHSPRHHCFGVVFRGITVWVVLRGITVLVLCFPAIMFCSLSLLSLPLVCIGFWRESRCLEPQPEVPPFYPSSLHLSLACSLTPPTLFLSASISLPLHTSAAPCCPSAASLPRRPPHWAMHALAPLLMLRVPQKKAVRRSRSLALTRIRV